MKIQQGVYNLFHKGAHLANVDYKGNVLWAKFNPHTVDLIVDQVKRGINKGPVCVTADAYGKPTYCELTKVLKGKGKRIGKTAEQLARSRPAQRLLKKAGLTKWELSRQLGVTFQKVDSVMEGKSEMPRKWEKYLKSRVSDDS